MSDSGPLQSETSPAATKSGTSRRGRLVPILTAGLIIAVYEVIFATSMASLIFSGPLSGYIAAGIGLALFGAIATSFAVAVFSSSPGTVGGVQDAPAAILATMAGAIVVGMPAGASMEASFVTVVATIAITAFLTGISLLGVGYFRLGNLVRFLPYPVIGGFLAGTGWLLFSGGLSMMSGLSLAPAELPAFFEPDTLLTWLPGLLWAIVAFVAMRRFHHPLLLPALIALAIVLFYAVAQLAGASTDLLAESGLLLGPVPEGQLWPPLTLSDLRLVNWPVILGQALSIVTIIMLTMVGVLLNASGLEVTFDTDMDLNRELRAAGAGNFLSGLGGGLVGYQQLSGSALVQGLKGASRWAGLLAAAISTLFLVFGGSALSLFPTLVLGGLLLLVGLSFLYEWLVEAWSKLPRQDYAIVVVIVLTTAAIGFLQAVILGLMIAIILFAVSYSRADVVRAELSGATAHSRVVRSRWQEAYLAQVTDQLVVFRLQGFIFFGTAHTICVRVNQRIDDPALDKPRFVILDFSRVTGLDSTASISFAKLVREAGGREIVLAIAAPKAAIWQQLLQADLCRPGDGFKLFSTLDRGVEWCEEQLLADSGMDDAAAPQTLAEQLSQITGEAAGIAALMKYLERLEVEAGQRLIAQGEAADTLLFVESGRVTAQLAGAKGQPLRLQSMGSGNVVGEVGFYVGGNRTADVIADEDGVVYRLSAADLDRLRQEDLQAASALHRLMAVLLAERVAHLTAVVEGEGGMAG